MRSIAMPTHMHTSTLPAAPTRATTHTRFTAGEHSAWISMHIGRLPSMTTVTALAAPCLAAALPSKNTAPGSGTADSPPWVISNTPTSSVGP